MISRFLHQNDALYVVTETHVMFCHMLHAPYRDRKCTDEVIFSGRT